MGMLLVDNLAIIIFFIAILSIGLIAARRVNTNNDYLLAGNRVGKWPLALSLAATDMGGSGLVGAMALSYGIGISGSLWDICAVPGLVVLAYILPKLFSGSRATTVPELIGKQYDERTRTFVAILQLISATLVIAVQNIVMSIVIQTLTGIEFETALVISAIVFIIYTTAGGLISVIWTDIFAYIVLFLGVIVSVVILLSDLGGLGHVVQSTPLEFWQLSGVSNVTILAWLLMNTFIYATSQPYIQRVLAARDKEAVKFAYIFTGVSYIAFGILVAILGIGAYVLNPSMVNPEYSTVNIIFQNLPVGIRSILMITFLAATMSTGSSYLNACASIYTIDIYKRLLKRNATDLQCLKAARTSTVLIAIASLIVSYFSFDIIEVVVYANLIYAATIFFPLMLSYKLDWLTPSGGFYGILVGLITGGGYGVYSYSHHVPVFHPIIIAASCSLVVLLIFSYRPKGGKNTL